MKEATTKEGFTFQIIPLADALNMVRAGDGVHSEISEMVLSHLPRIQAENKQDPSDPHGFSFGLPGKEVQEKDRRSICLTVNRILKQSGIAWLTSYSSKHKIFVCVPKKLMGKRVSLKGVKRPYVRQHVGVPSGKISKLLSKASKLFGVSVADITKKTNGVLNKPRGAVIVVAKEKYGISPQEIADTFGLHNSAIYKTSSTDKPRFQKELKALSSIA